ncbi:MAG: glycosyltransferase [Chthonomonadales bacterium]
MPNPPTVSVIIPAGDASRDQNLQLLRKDLQEQSLQPDEVEIVRGVAPNGRARNTGVERTTGAILVFLDDDVRLGTPHILRDFVQYLQADERLGIVGTSQLLPPGSSRFQQACARQIPRSQSAVVEELTESDMVTTACCAMRRAVLQEVGGFHDRILRGVDPELRHRVRQAGYRIAVIPNAWHYHPMPATLRQLLRMAWRNGAASAYARRHFPDTVLYNPEGHVGAFEARRSLARRVAGNAGRLLADLATGRWYGLLYGLAYAAGNLLGGRRP